MRAPCKLHVAHDGQSIGATVNWASNLELHMQKGQTENDQGRAAIIVTDPPWAYAGVDCRDRDCCCIAGLTAASGGSVSEPPRGGSVSEPPHGGSVSEPPWKCVGVEYPEVAGVTKLPL